MKAPIVLEPYDSNWPALFEIERQAMQRFGILFRAVHHVGSTSIPGMAAKPIIDILVVLDRAEDGLACVDAMRQLGYEPRGESGIAGRHYFRKGSPHAHHVHMFAADNPEAGRHLRFRDYLRTHPDEARDYEALKRMLSARFGSNTYSYSKAKDEFCARIERLAQLEATENERAHQLL